MNRPGCRVDLAAARRRRAGNLPRGVGFTLVEVLVALLVLALAMTALQLRMAQQLDSAAYLRERAIAQWVAIDVLERARLAARLGASFPEAGTRGELAMAGQTWIWTLQPQPLLPGMEKVAFVPLTVGVSAAGRQGEGEPLVRIDAVVEMAGAP